jgi:hypothetical protein
MMRWEGYVARMANNRNAYWDIGVKARRKKRLKGQGIDELIMLKYILRRYNGAV